jgi:hypothetical protein
MIDHLQCFRRRQLVKKFWILNPSKAIDRNIASFEWTYLEFICTRTY